MIEKLKMFVTRNVKNPVRAHEWDAGIDFFCPEDLTENDVAEKTAVTGDKLDVEFENGFVKTMRVKPGQSVLIPTGVKMKVPNGYVVNFENKSGVASKKHLVFGSKVIDAGYEGVVHVNLHNVGTRETTISAGEKMAQALMYAIEVPKPEFVGSERELYGDERSERGEGGFGSTDK